MLLVYTLIARLAKEICGNFSYVYQDKETDREELRKQLAEKDDFIKELKQLINHESLQSLAELSLPEEAQDRIDQSVNKEVCVLYLQKVCTNDMSLITLVMLFSQYIFQQHWESPKSYFSQFSMLYLQF